MAGARLRLGARGRDVAGLPCRGGRRWRWRVARPYDRRPAGASALRCVRGRREPIREDAPGRLFDASPRGSLRRRRRDRRPVEAALGRRPWDGLVRGGPRRRVWRPIDRGRRPRQRQRQDRRARTRRRWRSGRPGSRQRGRRLGRRNGHRRLDGGSGRGRLDSRGWDRRLGRHRGRGRNRGSRADRIVPRGEFRGASAGSRAVVAAVTLPPVLCHLVVPPAAWPRRLAMARVVPMVCPTAALRDHPRPDLSAQDPPGRSTDRGHGARTVARDRTPDEARPFGTISA